MAEETTNQAALSDQAAALSDQELNERLSNLEKFYDSQLPFLRKQHEYEKLHCEKDEFALRREIARLRLADLRKPADVDPTKETTKNPESDE